MFSSKRRFTCTKMLKVSNLNNRSLKLLDFANYFNLCPINLLQICRGPLETFVSHRGSFKSTIDYILLSNCLSDSIVSCKTFKHVIDLFLWTYRFIPIRTKLFEAIFELADQNTFRYESTQDLLLKLLSDKTLSASPRKSKLIYTFLETYNNIAQSLVT